MAELDRSVRVRSFVETWFVVIAIALVLVTGVAGWWAYQVNAVPDVEEEQRLVEQWSESTSYNHSAEIVNDSIPFRKGEVVRNRPIYYTNLSKELDGTYRYDYSADGGEVRVATETFLLVRGGEFEGQDVNATFWNVTERLESRTTGSLGPDGVHRVNFTVDIRSVLRTINTVQQQLGASEGLVDVRVRSVSSVEGTVEGETVSETYESDMIMVVNPATFRVAGTRLVDENHETFETVEVVAQPSPVEQFGSIGLFGLAAVGLVSLLVARVAGYTDLNDEERELLDIEQQREQYSEWITTGTFPSERNYEETILVDDLEGLIDVAIDTNKRVIEDPQLGVSTVLDDN